MGPKQPLFRANVVAVAPEFLGHEEFTEGKYWPQDIYIDEKKECYKQIGFTRYNNFTGIIKIWEKSKENNQIK